MSKINKFRFVNLNYNHNTMKIDDESFYLNGEHTMLNLRNGGGKSVLVQMLTAPFVNRRYRNTKDRTFESYFTSSTPTYILVEWKLDDNAGYLLTGMMVRKKDAASDEDSKEKLDIINFVHEYKERNDYDIDSIGVIEEKNDRRVVKSFANTRSLLEELKRDRNLKFNYYDMNNPVTTKNYFSKLEEYKINYREWETIIKQINMRESGLSELFTKAKDSSGLVKEWFLPAIENKLKHDEDRIHNYRELLDKYIKQYRQNKSNIDKKIKLELFNNLSIELLDICESFINNCDKKEETKNYIANVMLYLKEILVSKEEEELDLDAAIAQLHEQISELKYEEESIKIHFKTEELQALELEANKKQSAIDESKARKKLIVKNGNILECAKIHRNYQEASKDLQEQETKLEILSRKNMDNAPRINDLGFTIKKALEASLEEVKAQKNSKIDLKEALNSEKQDINAENIDHQKEIDSLNNQKGRLESSITAFDEFEDNINKTFNLNLSRNIESYFDEHKLLLKGREFEEEEASLNKAIKSRRESRILQESKLRGKESEKLRNLEKKLSTENKLDNLQRELEKQQKEIEIRKEVIKFVDFQEQQIFATESIISAFNRKITLLKEEESKLKKQYDNTNNEKEKLKTGKVLELPKDVEHSLRQKDINITYGMEWLKKNGYNIDKNNEIVKNNPFIPYSLIMNSREIEILERECMDIFTSFPLCIIDRTQLENGFNSQSENVVKLEGISFLISFNNKLLNEAELEKLIAAKDEELIILEKKLGEKGENIRFYEEKRNSIVYSSLSEETFENLKKNIKISEELVDDLRKEEIALEKSILTVKEELEDNTRNIANLEKDIETNKAKAAGFKKLVDEYEKYKRNKLSLDRIVERLSILKNQIDKIQIRKVEIDKLLLEAQNAIHEYLKLQEKIEKDISLYYIYKAGSVIEKDFEDLVSEYNALTKDINSSEQELKKDIEKLSKKFRDLEVELNSKVSRYELSESQYINEFYDIQREYDIQDELKRENKLYEELNENYNKLDKKLHLGRKELEQLYESLKSNLNKQEPKEKSLLVEKDFKLEINKIKIGIQDSETKKEAIRKTKQKVSQNLVGLNEFNDLVAEERVEIQINLDELDTTLGKLKRDLNNISAEETKLETKLRNSVVDMEIMEEFKSEALFKEPIQTLKSLASSPRQFKTQLNMFISSYEQIIGKLMADIDIIQKEEAKIIESMLDYIKDVHMNLDKIDDNSSINIGAKRLKMLNISVANWEENKELYKIRLKEYIEHIRNISLKALQHNEDIEDIVSNNINIYKIYDEVVGVETVSINLYKVEEDRQRHISWSEVCKNSGGEGFLSAFVILSSLLSYMRKDETDVFSRKESGKVIIMDNPFAQTSSAHLLKPLMDVAKKSNTQIIALTGLGGDSIYNRFDNIYVLNLISSKLKSGVKYLKSEHAKGEEEAEIMVASRFKIEEQVKLF